MTARAIERKASFLEAYKELQKKVYAVGDTMDRAASMTIECLTKNRVLKELDVSVRNLLCSIRETKADVIQERQSLESEEGGLDLQKDFLSLIQKYEELEKALRKREDQMLGEQKEKLALLQEVGEREQGYAHQIYDSLEFEWAELTQAPSREKAFHLTLIISKALAKFEEAELLWYNIVDRRLLFLQTCKKATYFPQLLREATFHNDLAMRATEYCEVVKQNLQQFKMLPKFCEEVFLIEEEVKMLDLQMQDGKISSEEAKQKLFWLKTSIKECQFHTSAKRELHKLCERILMKVDELLV